jgi:CheY-like chemotaxis protein
MDNPDILIVDDDVDLAAAMRNTLESESYSVALAENRPTGMEKAKSLKPRLIILDVMMEGSQDGFEMARELKRDEILKDTPILMTTSIQSETGIEFKSVAGDPTWLPVDEFLNKPVEPELLLAEVKKLLTK